MSSTHLTLDLGIGAAGEFKTSIGASLPIIKILGPGISTVPVGLLIVHTDVISLRSFSDFSLSKTNASFHLLRSGRALPNDDALLHSIGVLCLSLV